ncbi:hypothetical protein EX895_003281 [Sporisorium graminicola]|uniref:Metallo-beta-lactamase domain-containing protein n=1 Tax=Sporisorium graminicola TaxID=280036 RepID=A0A4U7KT84_9BASI|nr:hypothetical protein EX895_003281 [Sporisorium graminicola]TKY87700.1 hypothetical protein EX895_003281 [Sporisorium graminicola]
MATTEHQQAQRPHHERHHRTLSETIHGREKINGAESVSSSRSSSSDDDEPAAQGTTDAIRNVRSETSKAGATGSITYDITLNCRSTDPIADSHNLDADELPAHWVPTMLSQVTRATSTAFGQLTSPRNSTSSRTQQEQEQKENETEDGHILPRLTFRNPWEQSFRKPGIKGILEGGLKWGLPDSYTEGSGKSSKRSSGFKSSKKIQKELEIARQEDRELGDDWDKVDVVEPQWGWPSGHLQKEVDELRKEDREAHSSRAEHNDHKQEARKGTEADYKAKEQSLRDWSDPKTPSRAAARVTWLGHATTLLQLPPLSTSSSTEKEPPRSINILFDPIFSERCSPSQTAGPQRFTPAPCTVQDLPPIDFVVISHSHYDHLDYHTFKHLHHLRGDQIHALVPLGVKEKISGSGGFGWKREQVSELDWWDHARISLPSAEGAELKIVCTPAQHGSGRGAGDKDASLWASWVIEWKNGGEQRFCAFFAGDTGFKYHHDNPYKRARYPACPAFAEIAAQFQPFDLLLLPISVGSSLSYFRSWDPFPRAFSPFPRVSSTLTSSIHMDPYDAVECHQLFQQHKHKQQAGRKQMVSLAVHYGTFVRNAEQTRGDVRELRKACRLHGLKFQRVRDETCLLKGGSEAQEEKQEQKRLQGVEDKGEEQDVFLVADQGKTVWLPIHPSSSS